MANFDDLKLSVEALSGGTNTVKLDDIGMPSVMFVLPKYLSSQLNSNLGATVHPAWKLNNAEKDKVYISKYQNIVVNSRAYSLPMQNPAHTINWDNALAACRAKGEYWALHRWRSGEQSPSGARPTASCLAAITTTEKTTATHLKKAS